MLIYKNKASNKYFIFLEDSGDNEGLFVTPPVHDKAVIHSLSFDLFLDDPIELEENDSRVNELLSIKQIEKFNAFNERINFQFYKKLSRFAIRATEFEIKSFKKEFGDKKEADGWEEVIRLLKKELKGKTEEDLEQ